MRVGYWFLPQTSEVTRVAMNVTQCQIYISSEQQILIRNQ